MCRLFFLFFFTPILFVYGQQAADLSVIAKLNNQKVGLNQPIPWKETSFTITTLKFYITHCPKGSDQHGTIELLDWEEGDPVVQLRQSINETSFFFGTDSLTNVAGNVDGPLDPINGMYWAWNSGYINFKLEGYWALNKNNPVEFHIGGYRNPHATYRPFPLKNYDSMRELVIDLTPLLQYFSDQKINTIMIPGEAATNFTNQLINCFGFQ